MTALSAGSPAPTGGPEMLPEVSRRALPHVVRARVIDRPRVRQHARTAAHYLVQVYQPG